MSLPTSYFDAMYAQSEDPWGFTQRWYEQRKYALTLAALPRLHYARALEVGCSIGVLTALLAERCDVLTALDPSTSALRSAATRVPAHVRLVQGVVPQDWPAGPYDLVVLSEVAYYLDDDGLDALLDLVRRDASGDLVACHWRHPVTDYPQTGDAVHTRIGDRFTRLSRYEDQDMLLEVFGDGTSVARREGLV